MSFCVVFRMLAVSTRTSCTQVCTPQQSRNALVDTRYREVLPDQVNFVGVQLVIRSTLKIFPYEVLLTQLYYHEAELILIAYTTNFMLKFS